LGQVAQFGGFTPKTLTELSLNYSFYRDREIVPEHLQSWRDDASPVWDRVPTSYRWMADRLGGVHPMQIQYFVRNALFAQLDDVFKTTDLLKGKAQITEKADIPFMGPTFDRRAAGWLSQPVQTVADMEKRMKDAVQQATELRDSYGKATPEGKRQQAALDGIARAHQAYLKVQARQAQINVTMKHLREARAAGNTARVQDYIEQIANLKDRMTMDAITGLGPVLSDK
jgi:hypothetical protein